MTKVEAQPRQGRGLDTGERHPRPETGACLQLGSLKIRPYHLERLAIVYVRQSSPYQVIVNLESRALQYALVDRAVALGWHPDRVLVIDEDQGLSGKTAEGRSGFQRLLVEVNLDHVGLILGLEMSRLARSSKDWHHLLEVCRIFRTLLADQDGVYDPHDPNDRLLLGLKGTISEVELHTLRCRLAHGKLNKARRGDFFVHLPIGYVRSATDKVELDPDEQVRDVVNLVFSKFAELGSVSALLHYFVRHGIRLGIRPHDGPNRGQLEWRAPIYATLLHMLHNPIYAGAYSYGRCLTDPRRQIPGRRFTGKVMVPREQWHALVKDKVPAYITWEQYEANERQLKQNQARLAFAGPVRGGKSLLPGLLICGKCGARMLVNCDNQRRRHRYVCQRRRMDHGAPLCQTMAGEVIDAFVAQQVLRVLEPASLDLSIQAAEGIQRERERLHSLWHKRLERARYDVDRAARQYHAVEPENRLVARTLEQKWEQALMQQRQAEDEHDRFQREAPVPLSGAERAQIATLGADIAGLWNAATTTPADRKTIARHLVERVVVNVPSNSEYLDVTIHWQGGFNSQHELIRRIQRYEQLRDFPQLAARTIELHRAKFSAEQIAEKLNEEGFRPAKNRTTFNASTVHEFISRLRQKGMLAGVLERRPVLREHEWWLHDLARRINTPPATLHRWSQHGWVHARKGTGCRGRLVCWADAEEVERLCRLRHCRRGRDVHRPYPIELTTPKPRPDSQ